MRLPRPRIGLTRRGWSCVAGAVVCFALASWWQLPVMLWVSGLAASLLILSTAYALAARVDVEVRRTVTPEVAEPDDPIEVRLELVNRSRLTVAGGLWRDLTDSTGSGRFAPLGAAGAADDSWSGGYALRPFGERGRHLVGPLRLESTDPFGLIAFLRVVGSPTEVVVLPTRRPLLGDRVPVGGGVGATVSSSARSGAGEDDVIARPYVPGDALKRVNWKASAHSGQIMVRQEERLRRPVARIVLDPDAATHRAHRDADGSWRRSATLEWCVSAAASIVSELPGRGYDVTLCCGPVERAVDPTEPGLRAALVDLAVVEPLDGGKLRPRAGRADGTVVLLLGEPGVEQARRHIGALLGSTVRAVVCGRAPTEAIELMRAAGWRVVCYDPSHDDIARVWADGIRW